METVDPIIEARVREGFEAQRVMQTFGARLASVAHGEVVIELPFREDLTQQDGFLHAGVITTVVDSACGFAAFTTMPPDARVLSVEFKINLMAPAAGDRFTATGRVVRAGRTFVVCQGDVVAHRPDGDRQVALMQGTMMCVRPER